jgi:ankyrin repeat protein
MGLKKRSGKPPKEKDLFAAIEQKNEESMRSLLDQGINANALQPGNYFNGATALMYAAGCQFARGVELLIAAGADVKARTAKGEGSEVGWTALHSAITGNDSCPNDPSKRSRPEDRIRIVKLLLQNGADPYAAYNNDMTPLWCAANAQQADIVQYFVRHGVEPSKWPSGAMPPLNGAANAGSLQIAKFLVDHGAPINSQTQDGMTPLTSAAYRGAKDVVDYLLSKGADVNHRAADGRTALIAAAQFDRTAATARQHDVGLQIVESLLKAGARKDLVDRLGKTAVDHAINSPDPRVAELLK